MYDLGGKVALVTGAGGEHGMGRSIATRLAQEGADVIVNDIAANPYANRQGSTWRGVQNVVSEIEDLGRQAVAVIADVSDSASVEDMVSQGLDRFGHIDIMVNTVATRPGRDMVPVNELEEEAWDDVQRVNVKSAFLCTKAVSREMIHRGQGGKIIIISSEAGKRGKLLQAAYCSSKFALVGFTQAAALDLAPYHINVNAICPGSADTERMDYSAAVRAPDRKLTDEFRAEFVRGRDLDNPWGRIANAADVSKVAALLASSDSDYLTGLSISVTGGVTMT